MSERCCSITKKKKKKECAFISNGENVNILLSFMFVVVVRFSILLYIFLDVLQV